MLLWKILWFLMFQIQSAFLRDFAFERLCGFWFYMPHIKSGTSGIGGSRSSLMPAIHGVLANNFTIYLVLTGRLLCLTHKRTHTSRPPIHTCASHEFSYIIYELFWRRLSNIKILFVVMYFQYEAGRKSADFDR